MREDKRDSVIVNENTLLSSEIDLKTRELRRLALKCLKLGLKSIKPESLIKNSVKIVGEELIVRGNAHDLKGVNKLYIIGGGKASAEMAIALEEILLDNFKKDHEGIINIQQGYELPDSARSPNSNIRFRLASHPVPNAEGLEGTKEMLELVENATEEDLIICLISGGGSALLPMPKNGIELEDLQSINELLLASGASIHEINAIRKHLSKIKGGNLAKHVYKTSRAKLIALIISDVVGDDLDVIASGPTTADESTYSDALEVLKRHDLLERIPKRAKELLIEGSENPELETPKGKDECFKNVENHIIGSVSSAVEAIKEYLQDNYEDIIVEYFSNEISGEARDFGKDLLEIMNKRAFGLSNMNEMAFMIGTGELTVTITGNGIGGRNQEMLLSFLHHSRDTEFNQSFVIIGANLDGIEGNSEAMGALVDNELLRLVNEKQIDTGNYLRINDSNSFFKLVGTEIITGPTGCNVNDLLLAILKKK